LTNLPAKVVLVLGPHSAKALLGEASQGTPFGKLRGTAHSVPGLAAKAIVTYHPLQLLRQPLAKAQAWIDLKLTLKEAK
jgi:uracil-DNA glycosylase